VRPAAVLGLVRVATTASLSERPSVRSVYSDWPVANAFDVVPAKSQPPSLFWRATSCFSRVAIIGSDEPMPADVSPSSA
jgi:hypothetical protein